MTVTTSTAGRFDDRTMPITPEEAKPHAMSLLIELGDAIGQKAAIQKAINRTVDGHPTDWPLIVVCALAWTFAEHARLDPHWTRRPAGDAA